MEKEISLKIAGVAAAIMAFTPLVSCQVGLGAAVDTASPTIAISYPPASAVIKGTFVLAGTCSDDRGVSSVTVAVINTGTGISYGSYSATVTDSTAWSVSLNSEDNTSTYNIYNSYKKWALPDGTYELDVTANDASGHSSGTSSLTVGIDNTAPVLILSKPLAYGSETATSYGRSVKLAGDVSDDHTVSAITLNMKESAASVLGSLKTLSVSDFSDMSSDNPLVVAKYYTKAEIAAETDQTTAAEMSSLRTNYLSIYGDEADDNSTSDKLYYCGILLSDNAKTYQTVGDNGTGSGNETSVYYINNDTFYDDLMSDSTYSLTAPKLKNIINGTGSDYTASQITVIEKLLQTTGNYASSSDISSTASSKFSLNPDNNPTYTISGYETGSANNAKADTTTGFRSYTTGSTLYLSVSAGRDSIYVKPSTVAVKLYKLSSYSDTDYLTGTSSSDIQTVLSAGSWTDDSAISADYDFTLDSSTYSLKANKYYRLVVTGEDRDGNELTASCSDGYGFMVKSSYEPPEITFTSPDEDTLYSGTSANTSGFTIAGTITTDGLSLASVSPLTLSALTVTNTSSGSDVSTSISYTAGTPAITGSGSSYAFSMPITAASSNSLVPAAAGKYKYKITLLTQDSDGNTATATIPLYVDNQNPTISVSSVSPTATSGSDTTEYVNGTITVKGTAADNNELSDVSWKIYKSSDSSKTAVLAASLGTVESPSFTVDTTKLTDAADYYIALTAADSVGNTATAARLIHVKQNTDTPVLSLSNANTAIVTVNGIKNAYTNSAAINNIFGTSSNNSLLGTITDDDGIASVRIAYDTSAAGTFSSTILNNTAVGGSTSYSISGASFSSLSQGLYYIKITVADSKQDSTGYATLTCGTFAVAVDNGAPSFSDVTPASSVSTYYSGSLAVAGTVTDGSTAVTLSAAHVLYSSSSTASGASSSPVFTASSPDFASGAAWSDTLSLPTSSGQYKVIYTAADAYGQSTTYSIAYSVDVDAPVIVLSTLDKTALASANTYLTQGSHTFAGTVGDSGGSGLSAVTYTVKKSGSTTVASGTASVSSGVWSASIDMSSLSEGDYSIAFTAEDAAGNTASTSALTVYIDAGAPVLTVTTVGGSAAAALSDYYQTSTLTVAGIITETNLSTFTVTSSTGTITVNTIPSSGTDQVWSFTLPSEGAWKDISVKAVDKAGYTTTLALSTTLDKTEPSFTTGNTTYPDYINKTAYSSNSWYNATSLGISGCYTEVVSGIDAVYYQILQQGSSDTVMTAANYTTTKTGMFSPTDHGSIESYSTTIGSFASGTNTLYMLAVDKAGNISSVLEREINVDLETPSIEADSDDTILTNGGKDVTITGTATDDASGVDSITAYVGAATYTISSSNSTYGSISLGSSDKKSTTWSLSLNTTVLKAQTSGSTVSVYATVKDAAGNSSKVKVASLLIDTTPPATAISTPAVSSLSTINGTIAVTGTVTEANSPESISLYYATNPSADISGWTLYKTITVASGTDTATVDYNASVSDIYSWTTASFNFNTNSGASSASSGIATLYLLPVAYDEAGNCSVTDGSISSGNYTAYTVDMNGDRPVINITNISKNGGVLKYGTSAQLDGTVTDDDSSSGTVVSGFIASNSEITSAVLSGDGTSYSCTIGGTAYTFAVSTSGGTTTITNATYGTTYFTASSGDWIYQPATTADGSKNVYFFITDTNGTEFKTAASSRLYQPYIKFKNGTETDNSSVITYKSDSTAPGIVSGTAKYGTSAGSLTSTPTGMTTGLVLGGTSRTYAQFVITASDANGIAGMELSAVDSASASIMTVATAATVGDDTNLTNSDSDSFSATTDSTESVWTTDAVSLASYTTGSVTVTVKVYDQSGLYTSTKFTFVLDNTGPAITVTSPSQTEEVTGSVSMSGIATDSGGSSTSTTQWLIPTTTEAAAAATAAATSSSAKAAYLAALTWQGALASNKTAGVWEFDFDGTTNPLLSDYDSSTYYTSYSNGIYVLPVYFKSTDSLGNYTIKEYSVKHNPDADKPKTTITYPTDSDYDSGKQYITLGGTIRVTGTCVIPSGTASVSAVYIQIADSSGNFTYSGASSDKTTASGTYGYTVVDHSGAAISSGWTSDITETNWWGIAATKTSSTWYINLNSSGKMDPTADGTTNDITIRACAVNSDGKVGSWSTAYSVHIDNTAPTATASLNQYDTTGDPSSLTATATTAYTSDMYLKGSWYLVVKLADESGILSSSINVKKGTTSLTQGSDYYISSKQTYSSSSSGYYLYIPVSTSSSSVTYTVSATDTDSNGHTISPSYSLNTDNTAPTINTLKGNSTALTASTPIADSNYVYTLSSSVNEEGSGFSKMVFYYMRTASNVLSSGNECVLDPMISYSTDSSAKVLLTNLTKLSITQGTNTYYLYGKTVSGSSTQSSTQSFTPAASSDITSNSHIRVGGLIYIGGVYRIITAISSSDGTVTFDSDASATYTTAVFPYAQVVDNTSSETISAYSTDPFTFSNSSDDGDGMPESISKAGTTWTWSGTVHSTHMPDGPVTVVCLAFDDAGNVSESTVSTTVSNNPPRLAKIHFGTDLNGDGYYTTDEIEQYDMYSKLGTYQSAVSIATADYQGSAFKIKNTLAVVPEFTGGNGSIVMVFDKNATSTAAETSTTALITATTTVSATGTSATLNTSPFSSASITKLSADTLSAYTIANTALESTVSDANDGTGKSMSFTFWDSTEETTPGTDSQNCVLRVTDFTLDLVDGVAPTSIVDPFYWNSSSDNSLYGNSTDNGHIELPADWKTTSASGYDSSASSGEYDGDTKVSGKVNITGTAYDDQRLTSLWICFDTATSTTSLMAPSAYTAADTYTFTSAGAVNTTTEDTTGGTYATSTAFYFNSGSSSTTHTYYRVATYNSSANTWTTYSNPASGWTFAITDSTLTQSGHTAAWKLTWDSSLISTVAASDVCMRTLALDSASTSTTYTGNASPETTTTGTNVPYYQMDVVPYITTVTGQSSKLASLKSNNASVYGRSALGKYPVNASESILISGFNLGNSTYTATAVLPQSSGTSYDSVSTSHTFSVSSTDTSGTLTLQVNSISSLNNVNNNDSAGAYTTSSSSSYTKYSNWYNRRPNNDNNNLLNDDVKLNIWSFDSDAAIPISGRIQNPVMGINPSSGMVGFAFINGPLYYSMGGTVGGTEYSYNYWEASYDFFTSIGFAYDSLGYSYGCAAGGDINSSSADDFSFMTSRWGRAARAQAGSYEKYNSRRLEQIGMNIGGTYTFDKTRIQSPSFATAVHGSSTNVYLAYYDDMNAEIRLRRGTISANNTSTDSLSNGTDPGTNSSGNASNFNFYVDQYGTGSSTNTQVPQAYNITNTSLIAGTTSGYSTGYNAGEYVSLGIVSSEGSSDTDDVLVVVWYDATNQELLYSYYVDPTNITAGTYSRTGWSTPVAVFGSTTGVGQYCKIAVDKNKGIHIAAYDQTDADLVYAYSSGYAVTSSSGFSTCTVDSYGITGSEITLDAALDSSGKAIPYIGYYANSCIKPKVAYKVTTSSNAPAGESDDAFTGAWEVSVLPTTSTVPEDHINVGVWKSSGVLAKSNVFTNTTTSGSNAATNSGSSYSATNYGKIYGNGTSNPILGYEIKSGTSGYIETAQIK